MDKAARPITRRQTLGITLAAMCIVAFFWLDPLRLGVIDTIMIPLRLFVTYVHEAGHSLAALLTGGRIVGFQVSADGSGVAYTAGGSRALVISAGYLGSAAFGALLFFIVNRLPRWVNPISFLLGGAMILFTVMFARPDSTGSPLALIVGVAFGFLLVFMGWKASDWLTVLALNLLAIMTSLTAVLDVWGDLVTYGEAFNRFGVRTDAVAFSQEVMPILPPVAVGVIWSALAVLMLLASVYYAVWKPMKAEVNDAYARLKE